MDILNGLLTQPFMVWVIVPVAVALIVIRQVFPQKVTLTSFVVLPILVLYEVLSKGVPSTLGFNIVLEFALTSVISIISGVLQASVSSVYEKDSQVFVKGGLKSLTAYAILASGRILIHLAVGGGLAGFVDNLWILWGAIGIEWCTRSAMLYLTHPKVALSLQTQFNERRERRSSRRTGQSDQNDPCVLNR